MCVAVQDVRLCVVGGHACHHLCDRQTYFDYASLNDVDLVRLQQWWPRGFSHTLYVLSRVLERKPRWWRHRFALLLLGLLPLWQVLGACVGSSSHTAASADSTDTRSRSWRSNGGICGMGAHILVVAVIVVVVLYSSCDLAFATCFSQPQPQPQPLPLATPTYQFRATEAEVVGMPFPGGKFDPRRQQQSGDVDDAVVPVEEVRFSWWHGSTWHCECAAPVCAKMSPHVGCCVCVRARVCTRIGVVARGGARHSHFVVFCSPSTDQHSR